MIQSKIIADSTDPRGNRLTTFVITFPRIILAEFNTHRMFSRNSASSRAIPFEKMVKSVKENPFIPIAWQKDHKGMQGTEYFNSEESQAHINWWLKARDHAIMCAKALHSEHIPGKVTKQICNRLLEPFMWHTVILTSGLEGLENFFKLRCPIYKDEMGRTYRSKKDFYQQSLDPTEGWMQDIDSQMWLDINKGQSEIHMMALAEVMWDCYNESKSKELLENQWHIPFGNDINPGLMKYARYYNEVGITQVEYPSGEILRKGKTANESIIEFQIKIATARCARISYTIIGEEEKEPDYENDIKLYNRLLESKHFSPFEHCARVMNEEEYTLHHYKGSLTNPNKDNIKSGWCNNFKGFIQQRYLIENENPI